MDDLDDVLKPQPVPTASPWLSDVVLRDAGTVQRRRRWLGHARRAAVFAACYAAGLASMWYWPWGHTPVATEVAEQPPEQQRPTVETSPDADPFRFDPPERVEKWAFLQTGQRRAELYRRAGDGYLLRDDVQAALRCYRRALDGGSVADLAIRAESDTWLLMSLKLARQREKVDARVN